MGSILNVYHFVCFGANVFFDARRTHQKICAQLGEFLCKTTIGNLGVFIFNAGWKKYLGAVEVKFVKSDVRPPIKLSVRAWSLIAMIKVSLAPVLKQT